MNQRIDVAIIGGGIIGLASAWTLLNRFPARRVAVFEKEPDVARHQTGRNSGVLHSGVYYRPGSHRAITCRKGKAALEAFCASEGIPLEVRGKVIVAVERAELPELERLHARGRANGVRCELIDAGRLRELEPHVAGLRAIHVPEAGVVDFGAVSRALAQNIRRAGGEIHTGTEVRGILTRPGSRVLQTSRGSVEADYVVNCAGLHSDRVARLAGASPGVRIIPFRGEYHELTDGARHLCRSLVYPVPDPELPFLGVHFTRTIEGRVHCGPSAVPAFAREGYAMTRVNLRDLAESITFPGFLRLAGHHWKFGLEQMGRSLSVDAFVRELRRLVPEVRREDLRPAPAGVRAQAVDRKGKLVEDFLVLDSDRAVHVCNAPSPAATASLAIGDMIIDRLAQRF